MYTNDDYNQGRKHAVDNAQHEIDRLRVLLSHLIDIVYCKGGICPVCWRDVFEAGIEHADGCIMDEVEQLLGITVTKED